MPTPFDPTLETPEVSRIGDLLQWAAIHGASSYDIFDSDSYTETVNTNYIDLTSLQAGQHSLKAKAKGTYVSFPTYKKNGNAYEGNNGDYDYVLLDIVIGRKITIDKIDYSHSEYKYIKQNGAENYIETFVDNDDMLYCETLPVQSIAGTIDIYKKTETRESAKSSEYTVYKFATPTITSETSDMIMWSAIQNVDGYDIYINGNKKSDCQSDTYYSIGNLDAILSSDTQDCYTINVQAVKDNSGFVKSNMSVSKKLKQIKNLSINQYTGHLTWTDPSSGLGGGDTVYDIYADGSSSKIGSTRNKYIDIYPQSQYASLCDGQQHTIQIISTRTGFIDSTISDSVSYTYVDYSNFSSLSWDVIKQLSGVAGSRNLWSVGDKKAIELNGSFVNSYTYNHHETYVYILHFTSNGVILGGFIEYNGGSYYPTVLIDMNYDQSIPSGQNGFMYHDDSTASPFGLWHLSYIRNNVLGSTNVANGNPDGTELINPGANTLMSILHSGFRSVLSQMLTVEYPAEGSQYNYIYDYCKLLSQDEITGDGGNYYDNEYRYSFFISNKSQRAAFDGDYFNTGNYKWWIKDPWWRAYYDSANSAFDYEYVSDVRESSAIFPVFYISPND